MLGSLLGALSEGGIRGLARNLFKGFWERGISANKALQELRGQGLGYRRQDFLRDFAAGKQSYTQETKIKYVNRDAVPSEGILQPQYFGTPDRYSFVFKATGTDPNTGEAGDRYFTYHRNSLDTRGNMEQDAQDWLTESAQSYGLDVEEVSIKEGYINPGWV